ncbi:translation initiation factor IF-2-like [Ursus americanus]|uniref:translation initiation factor IF-2-like n=1 Tax=Ursus americanus TaxID=9643 RepID=UPI001E67AEDA|nr:translation initiation factor IF-2-like [Ursus americanus]
MGTNAQGSGEPPNSTLCECTKSPKPQNMVCARGPGAPLCRAACTVGRQSPALGPGGCQVRGRATATPSEAPLSAEEGHWSYPASPLRSPAARLGAGETDRGDPSGDGQRLHAVGGQRLPPRSPPQEQFPHLRPSRSSGLRGERTPPANTPPQAKRPRQAAPAATGPGRRGKLTAAATGVSARPAGFSRLGYRAGGDKADVSAPGSGGDCLGERSEHGAPARERTAPRDSHAANSARDPQSVSRRATREGLPSKFQSAFEEPKGQGWSAPVLPTICPQQHPYDNHRPFWSSPEASRTPSGNTETRRVYSSRSLNQHKATSCRTSQFPMQQKMEISRRHQPGRLQEKTAHPSSKVLQDTVSRRPS